MVHAAQLLYCPFGNMEDATLALLEQKKEKKKRKMNRGHLA